MPPEVAELCIDVQQGETESDVFQDLVVGVAKTVRNYQLLDHNMTTFKN
jgi:hypothetical protein